MLWAPDTVNWLIRKDPDAGKDWRQERRGQQRMKWLDGIIDLIDMSLSRIQEMVKDREAWWATGHVVTERQTWRSDWTATKVYHLMIWDIYTYTHRNDYHNKFTKDTSGECVTSSVVSPQQRFEMEYHTSITARLQLSIFSASKGKYTLDAWGQADPKGEASIHLGPLLLYVRLLRTPWACPMQIRLAKKGMCLFHLKFSLLFFGIFFCSVFVGFSPFYLLATIILDCFPIPTT